MVVLCTSKKNAKINVFSPRTCVFALNYNEEYIKYNSFSQENNIKSNKSKKKKKINNQDFTILGYSEYKQLFEFDYKVKQLKELCEFYKLRKTGNKEQLINRVFNYLRLSNYSIKIQSYWRGYAYRRYINGIGPALGNTQKCVNETDFFTLDEISKIPYNQLFSYKDKDDFIYAFDIMSFFNLIKKSGKVPLNPYNRNKIYKDILLRFNRHIELSRILQIPVTLKMEKFKSMSDEKKFEMEVVELFQEIDNLGNYTSTDWFLTLGRQALIQYIRELYDIWMYRADLTQDVKRSIFPPTGNLFSGLNISNILVLSVLELKKQILDIMKKIVRCGINRDSKSLGAYYLLAALTLVNHDAAIALPWLFESVVY